jgi:hypothetical protein
MCIIIFKPAGVRLPDRYTLYKCEVSNPHGFGFATPKRVFHSMNRKDFERELKANATVEEPCIIHCRIATHGSIKKSNCHPFVDLESGVAFAHNGMLDIKPIGDKTDSETAFLTRFVPVIREHGIHGPELDAAVDEIIGFSRFIFMDADGEVRMFGHWYRGADGCYYSHLPW